MVDIPSVKHIDYEYPFFTEYLQPKGALTLDKGCHACFYYAMLAMKARALAGNGPDSQIISYKVGETPPEWMESRDEELAKSVALIYGLESPDAFLCFRKEAWTQAAGLGIHVPLEVFLVKPGARPAIH